jgi:hypothetical protein
VNDICRMMKRLLADASLPARLSPHSFRVAVITDLLEQGVSLEEVRHLAGHADPRTTRLYDLSSIWISPAFSLTARTSGYRVGTAGTPLEYLFLGTSIITVASSPAGCAAACCARSSSARYGTS